MASQRREGPKNPEARKPSVKAFEDWVFDIESKPWLVDCSPIPGLQLQSRARHQGRSRSRSCLSDFEDDQEDKEETQEQEQGNTAEAEPATTAPRKKKLKKGQTSGKALTYRCDMLLSNRQKCGLLFSTQKGQTFVYCCFVITIF